MTRRRSTWVVCALGLALGVVVGLQLGEPGSPGQGLSGEQETAAASAENGSGAATSVIRRELDADREIVEYQAAEDVPKDLIDRFVARFWEFHESEDGLLRTYDYEHRHFVNNLNRPEGRYLLSGTSAHNSMGSALPDVDHAEFPDLLFQSEHIVANIYRNQAKMMARYRRAVDGEDSRWMELVKPARVEREPFSVPVDVYVRYFIDGDAKELSASTKERLADIRDRVIYEYAQVSQELMYLDVSASQLIDEMGFSVVDEQQFFAQALPEYNSLQLGLEALRGHYVDAIRAELSAADHSIVREF